MVPPAIGIQFGTDVEVVILNVVDVVVEVTVHEPKNSRLPAASAAGTYG